MGWEITGEGLGEDLGSLAIDWIDSIHVAQLASFSAHISIDIDGIEVSNVHL